MAKNGGKKLAGRYPRNAKHSRVRKIAKVKLLDFLSNFENKWPDRQNYSVEILGYKSYTAIYDIFSPAEIAEIEAEAFQIMKKRMARPLKSVYRAVFKDAIAGDSTSGRTSAAKLFIERIEGKMPQQTDINVDIQILNSVLEVLPAEYAESVREQLSNVAEQRLIECNRA